MTNALIKVFVVFFRSDYLDVETFFKKGSNLIQKYRDNFNADSLVSQNILKEKENIPLFQLLSMYLISYYRSKIYS